MACPRRVHMLVVFLLVAETPLLYLKVLLVLVLHMAGGLQGCGISAQRGIDHDGICLVQLSLTVMAVSFATAWDEWCVLNG